jgi:uncharacterized protein (DUF697 family)
MELLFVILGGAMLGLGFRYAFPGRHSYGVLLLPSLGASIAAAVWAALTWAGWKYDGGWIWAVTLVIAGVGAIVAAIVIARIRTAADESMLERLSHS